MSINAHDLSLYLTRNNRLTMITERGEKIDQSRLQKMIEDWMFDRGESPEGISRRKRKKKDAKADTTL